MPLSEYLPFQTTLFFLAFARVGTLVMLMPAVGEILISPRVRLAFALILTAVLYPHLTTIIPVTSGISVITVLIHEILIGLMLGLTTRMVSTALQTAGVVIAQQLGLAFAMTVDPVMGGQNVSISNFLTLLGFTLILSFDLHHGYLLAIESSYRTLPPLIWPETGDAAQLALRAIAYSFALSVQLSAPFLVMGIVFNLGVGLLARLMPQFQVYFVTLPATILLGFALLMISLAAMLNLYLEKMQGWLRLLLGAF
jgi:flagellar biosynthesis protein FliR